MSREVVIKSLPQTFRVIKEMNVGAAGWDFDYRLAGRPFFSQLVVKIS